MDRAGLSKKMNGMWFSPVACLLGSGLLPWYGPLRISKAQECPDWNVSFHFFFFVWFPIIFLFLFPQKKSFCFYYKNSCQGLAETQLCWQSLIIIPLRLPTWSFSFLVITIGEESERD